MRISGIAIGQWKNICKKKSSVRRTNYKIHRAIAMGKVTHKYEHGDYVVRYYDLNLLVDKTGVIMTIWRDTSTPIHEVPEYAKQKYDLETSFKQNIRRANFKHRSIVGPKPSMTLFAAYSAKGKSLLGDRY